MNNKLLQWIRANLLGIFGCMYLPKEDSKEKIIVCDISFFIIYTIIAITTVIFFTTIICHANIASLKELNETEKFWWSFYRCTNICIIFYFVANIFRWVIKSKSNYTYEAITENKVTEEFYVAPFISYDKFTQYYDENERKNKAKQDVLNKYAEKRLQSDINELINRLNKNN